MRYTGPKVKKARRLGQAFTEKDAKILRKRSTAPGQHGAKRGRLSEVAIQLREKQRAKMTYGVQEKQFVKTFDKARKLAGVTGDNLIKLLEMRLDNVVFRLGFAKTRNQARQIVNHGFIAVNGKKVDIASYNTRVGEVISIRDSKTSKRYVNTLKEEIKSYRPQDWIDLDNNKLSGKVLSAPTPEQVGSQINTQLIVEHYSRI